MYFFYNYVTSTNSLNGTIACAVSRVNNERQLEPFIAMAMDNSASLMHLIDNLDVKEMS